MSIQIMLSIKPYSSVIELKCHCASFWPARLYHIIKKYIRLLMVLSFENLIITDIKSNPNYSDSLEAGLALQVSAFSTSEIEPVIMQKPLDFCILQH